MVLDKKIKTTFFEYGKYSPKNFVIICLLNLLYWEKKVVYYTFDCYLIFQLYDKNCHCFGIFCICFFFLGMPAGTCPKNDHAKRNIYRFYYRERSKWTRICPGHSRAFRRVSRCGRIKLLRSIVSLWDFCLSLFVPYYFWQAVRPKTTMLFLLAMVRRPLRL